LELRLLLSEQLDAARSWLSVLRFWVWGLLLCEKRPKALLVIFQLSFLIFHRQIIPESNPGQMENEK